MPLFPGANGRHNARRFTRLDDHHHLVGLRLFKVRFYEFVAPTFGVVHDLHAPFLRAVLGPVVILVRHRSQNAAAHWINLSKNPEKTLSSGSVQEGLNAAIQEKTVKAAVAKLDVILMVLEKGI